MGPNRKLPTSPRMGADAEHQHGYFSAHSVHLRPLLLLAFVAGLVVYAQTVSSSSASSTLHRHFHPAVATSRSQLVAAHRSENSRTGGEDALRRGGETENELDDEEETPEERYEALAALRALDVGAEEPLSLEDDGSDMDEDAEEGLDSRRPLVKHQTENDEEAEYWTPEPPGPQRPNQRQQLYFNTDSDADRPSGRERKALGGRRASGGKAKQGGGRRSPLSTRTRAEARPPVVRNIVALKDVERVPKRRAAPKNVGRGRLDRYQPTPEGDEDFEEEEEAEAVQDPDSELVTEDDSQPAFVQSHQSVMPCEDEDIVEDDETDEELAKERVRLLEQSR